MPEPAPITGANDSAQRVKKRAKKSDAINRRQPQRHGRFFLHPVHRHLFLHAKKMHRGAATFLHETPQRLDVIMMHAATANPQPATAARAVFPSSSSPASL